MRTVTLLPRMTQILVMDDDPGMRAMLDQILKLYGYDVVLAANGKEGLELFRSRKVDLVISDLYMPEKEGLETIKEIHRDSPEVPIIAMSGKQGKTSLLSVAQHFGAARILVKPFNPQDLLTAVEEVLKLKS